MNNNTQPIEILDDEFLEPFPEETFEPKTKSEYIAKLKSSLELFEEIFKELPELRFDTSPLYDFLKTIESYEDKEFEELCEQINSSPSPKETIETEQELKEIEKMLPTLQSTLPLWHIMSIQKLVTELQHKLINSGAVDIIVANKGKKNEITSYVLATYDEVDGVTSLTEFDRQVHDAVSSLWEHGHQDHIVTPDMVARAMMHKINTEKVSPQFKGAVTKSIEKMRRIHITLDATEEVRKRKTMLNEDPNISCKIDDYLLSFKGIEVSAGGRTVKGYLMQSEPLLLYYAKRTKQLATVDARLLDIKEVDQKGNVTTVSIKSNETRVAVNGYLLRRIAVMKNDRQTNKKPKQSNIILFSTLFEEAGIPHDSHAKRVKDYAFQVLDYFKAMGYIKGYTKRKNRKSFDAVIINL